MSLLPNLSNLTIGATELELRRDREDDGDERSLNRRDRDDRDDRDDDDDRDDRGYRGYRGYGDDNNRVQLQQKLYTKPTLVANCLPFDSSKFESSMLYRYDNEEQQSNVKFADGKTLLDDVNYFYTNFKIPTNFKGSTDNLKNFYEFLFTKILPTEDGRAAICDVLDRTKETLKGMRGVSKYGYYLRRDLTNKHVYVIGDVHGSLHSLCDILMEMKTKGAFYENGSKSGKLKDNVYVVCTGDILDRSPYTLECTYLMLRLFADNPQQVTITLGNHETDEGLWTNPNGSLNEMAGEYQTTCTNRGDMKSKLIDTLKMFPRSFIGKTSLGVIQFNHGSFETIQSQSQMAKFSEFTSFQPGTPSTLLVFEPNGAHLNWGDINTDPSVSGKYGSPDRPVRTAKELNDYLNRYGMRMLIRGHSDLANLSLVYRNGSAPSEALQQEDSSPVPDGDVVYKMWGFDYNDKRPRDMIKPNGTFVLGLIGFTMGYLYDMYTLTFLPDSGQITKTLVQEGRNDPTQDDLKAVTSSTAVFSKLFPPMMLMTCFLYLE